MHYHGKTPSICFCRLNERKMLNEFFCQQFCPKRAQTEMANANMTKEAVKYFEECLVTRSNHLLVGFSIFNSQLLD